MGMEKYRNGFAVATHESVLNKPLTWKKPRLVFVNSMSDLFHKSVPTSFIQSVFEVMNEASQHTFQVLTKRPSRASQAKRQGQLDTQYMDGNKRRVGEMGGQSRDSEED